MLKHVGIGMMLSNNESIIHVSHPPPPPQQNASRDITLIDFVKLSRLLVCLPFDYVYIKKQLYYFVFIIKTKSKAKNVYKLY